MRKRFTDRISHIFLSLILVLTATFATAQDAKAGKSLFNANCAACHKLDKKLIGPALAGITEKRDAEWLHAWIKDNAALRASGDADAIAIFEEYNGSVMTAFPNLSDEDIDNILAYTAEVPAAPVAGPATGAEAVVVEEDNTVFLIGLGAVLLLLIVLLVRVKNTLKQVKGQPATNLMEDANIITRTALKNPRIMTLITIVIAVIFLQQLFLALNKVGVTQDYQPEQPIAFSHKLHAGDNQIDCNYCHYGARKSMESNIPSANVCMNCHMNIQEGPTTGTEEISKIYAAVGFDPEAGSYIEGYEQKPIKWVRIHDLPDLSYFNHSQHVTAGGLDCQTCHGPVEEMEEVYQYSPLTMGWCVNCHRETKVKVESNDYYTEMHEKLKEKYGKDANITVEMIGGLECGKCHY
ncbi:cytochrome c2 [Owenweeksia hongkongensis DSM 17368]|uniref:Cytochrome c2 n=1 Tax=Owenweeksia hongkongensis (strain DSM 17368 / CIP 108786 / JCM 12287 / NRRL B-23963 / UST20020801) TaxID=926562 RepID=G8R2B9_OWEHD|nr:c-type cytochrome [Owenweeksia hongkongensis]AEV32909.1 cytochrome c2 [Owenweeksia hongkongensis DSM 17368]